MLYGQQFIAGHGVATVLPDVDFETYSEAGFIWNAERQKWEPPPGIAATNKGLPAVGVRNYVQHPTFELLCVAYDLKDGHGKRFWRPGMSTALLLPLHYHVIALGLLEAHNVFFEWTVWQYHCVPKLGWPPLTWPQMRCSAAKCAAWSLPRALKEAGPASHAVELKDDGGKALIMKLTVPRNPTKTNPALRWTPETAPDDFARFYAYNVQDVIAESDISVRVPDLSPREFEIWQVDQSINDRGMGIDLVGVSNAIAIVEQATVRHNATLREITNYAVENFSEVAKTVEWMKTRGVYLEGLDEDTVSVELKKDHPADIKAVLSIRQALSFGSTKKLWTMQAQTCADGRLRDQYTYHGAHTSLWNGRAVQMANLYSPQPGFQTPGEIERAFAMLASRSMDYVEGIYNMPALEVVANCLRSMVVASPGHTLFMSDFTAIQAVVLAGLAGEKWRLEVFRTHGKIYEATAGDITGKGFQFYIDYKKQHGTHHPDRKIYGKIPELAAGFASWIQGWVKFGAGEFMTEAEIKQAILKWRAASPNIVELWGGQTRNKFNRDPQGRWAGCYEQLYGLEGAAIAAVKYPGTSYGYRGIRYQMHGDVLYCQPPGGGMPLCYHEPRLQKSERPYADPWELELSYVGWNSNQTKGKGGWVRMKLYAGILTQNVVAKVAREYQADALVRLERSGKYLPVMHTHDEQVAEVPLLTACFGTDEYHKLVQQPRPDCADEIGPWPIKVPGIDVAPRYGKYD